jgi:hypothetical protein
MRTITEQSVYERQQQIINTAYEARERTRYHQQRSEVECDPLSDRQAARTDWLEAMRDTPQIVAERVSWLLAGDYGYGAMHVAREVATNTRMNRVAGLGQMIASLEWRCPAVFAIGAWKQLTTNQQNAVTREIQRAINTFIDEAE